MYDYEKIFKLSVVLLDIHKNTYSNTCRPAIQITDYVDFAMNYGLKNIGYHKYEERSFSFLRDYPDKYYISAYVVKDLNEIGRIVDDVHTLHNYLLLNTNLCEKDSIVAVYDRDTFYDNIVDKIFSQVYLAMRNIVNTSHTTPDVSGEVLNMLACAYYAYKSCMISDDDENNRIDVMYYRLTGDRSANHSNYSKMLLKAFHHMDEAGCDGTDGYEDITEKMIEAIHDAFYGDANEARYCLLGIQVGAVRNS